MEVQDINSKSFIRKTVMVKSINITLFGNKTSTIKKISKNVNDGRQTGNINLVMAAASV